MLQPEHLRRVQPAAFAPRRLISIGFVAIFHLAVVYAFISGLAQRVVEKLPEDIIAKVEPPKLPDIKPPPPPPPKLEQPPPPYVPPPDIVIQEPATTNAITVQHAVSVPPPPKPQGITAPALIANGRANCATNYYPPISVRLNQEGATTVTLHIGADGAVDSAEVANSSGHDSLDQASIKCVTSGNWRFHPAMQNGQPVPTTRQYIIKWQLQG